MCWQPNINYWIAQIDYFCRACVCVIHRWIHPYLAVPLIFFRWDKTSLRRSVNWSIGARLLCILWLRSSSCYREIDPLSSKQYRNCVNQIWVRGQVRMVLRLLFFSTSLLMLDVNGHFPLLYNANRTTKAQFDCIYSHIVDDVQRLHEPFLRTAQLTPYCMRPSSDDDTSRNSTVFGNIHSTLTFLDLRKQGLSSQQLLAWSRSVDLLEQYASYLTTNDTQSDRLVFYNCSSAWFGSHCQYTFRSPTAIHSFGDFVRRTFEHRVQFTNSLLVHTCYPYLPECIRGPAPMCLDWREICDGKVDCVAESFGLDEQQCDQLEVNECSQDEYRCHNGAQCIPLDFVRDGITSTDCLDRTDELEFDTNANFPPPKFIVRCINVTTFSCEEITCRHPSAFACGDGSCYEDNIIPFHSRTCKGTGRDWNFTRAMLTSFDHLSSACGKALSCALRYPLSFDDTYSEEQCLSELDLSLANNCPGEYVWFPVQPVLYGYFQFVYRTNRPIAGFVGDVTPDFVCNDPRQCLSLSSQKISINGLDCRPFWQLSHDVDDTDHWAFIGIALRDTIRTCSTKGNASQCPPHSTLFHCTDSKKCISKHRLLDGILDCYHNEDETFTDSCSLNDSQRFSCTSEKKCLSPMALGPLPPNCLGKEDSLSDLYRRSPFTRLCSILPEISPDYLGETDETHCDWWPCNNPYTRCDGSYQCSNGIDELNCPDSKCGLNEFMCKIEDSDEHLCISLSQIYDERLNCTRAGIYEPMSCRELFYANHTDSNDTPHFFWDRNPCPLYDDICDRPRLSKPHPMCPIEMQRLQVCSGYLRVEATDEMLCFLMKNSFKRRPIPLFSSLHMGNFPSTRTTSVSTRRQSDDVKEKTVPFNASVELSGYCNRGILVFEGQSYTKKCLCPPSYFGARCQWQSQRVSLTIRFQWAGSSEQRHAVYHILISLIHDRHRTIEYYEDIHYVSGRDCSTKYNVYLLYPIGSKRQNDNYSVHIDAFDKHTLDYHASWHLSIPFPFLPVNRLAAQFIVPTQKARPAVDCPLQCGAHGQCFQYTNLTMYFCQCVKGYSGAHCNHTHQCSCSADSVCVSSSLCVCPQAKFGSHCHLQRTACQTYNPCAHNGECVPVDHRIAEEEFICLCTEDFMGPRCEQEVTRIDVTLNIAVIPPSIFVHFITKKDNAMHERTTTFRRVPLDEHSVTLFVSQPFNLVFMEVTGIYYLAVRRENFIVSERISAEIKSNYNCPNIAELFNATVLAYHSLRRLKHYQVPCIERHLLKCFYDDELMCVCDMHRYANCFEFTHNMNYTCRGINHCENEGQCFQDNSTCPTRSMCMCQECFYGSRCQFITKGFGLSFDAIFGYQIKPSVSLSRQSLTVKVNVALTTLMLLLGFISGILSILTFQSKQSIEVGCGLYLRASSIISILTISMFYVKFWQLVLSQMNVIASYSLRAVNCVSTDILLKVLLTTGDWLHACVAIERTVSVAKGVTFNKTRSKTVAKWIMPMILLLTTLTHIHDPIHRELMEEVEEQRIWCIIKYSPSVKIFDKVINIFHFLAPFSVNLISALAIIISTARSRSNAQKNYLTRQHLRTQFRHHKHLIISSVILIILALPRLAISLLPGCMKSYRDPWLFLAGYYTSFIPPMLVFVVYVVPSETYTQSLMMALTRIKRRLRLFARSTL